MNAGNPFIALQEAMSKQIVAALDRWRDTTEAVAERTFLSVYGSPTLQAAVGIDPEANRPLRKAAKSPLHRELLQDRIADLKARIPEGGLREAVIRGMIYVGMGRGAVDERGFEAVRRVRRSYGDIPLSTFKALVREQYFMLLVDSEGALAAIPAMLPADAETRQQGLELIKQVLTAIGGFSATDRERLDRISPLFEDDASGNRTPFRQSRKELQAKAS